jgi:hypothetical protein
MCYTGRGVGGGNCDEWCAQGKALFTLDMILMFVGLALSIMALYTGLKIWRRKAERSRRTVVSILAAAGFGAFFYSIGAIIDMVNTVGIISFFIITPEPGTGRLLKRSAQSVETTQSVFMALAGCVGICSLFMLPLAWIQIAQRAVRLKKQIILAVQVWAVFFVLVLLCVQFPLYMLATADFRSDIQIYGTITLDVWYAVLSFCAFANLVAFVKMSKVRSLAKNPYPNADFVHQSDDTAGNASAPTMSKLYFSVDSGTFSECLTSCCRRGPRKQKPAEENCEQIPAGLPTSSTDPEHQASLRFARRLYSLIFRIQVASLAIAILCIVVCVLNYVQSSRFYRTPYTDPRCDVVMNGLTYRLSLLFTQFALGVVIWFFTPTAFRKPTSAPSSFRGVRNRVKSKRDGTEDNRPADQGKPQEQPQRRETRPKSQRDPDGEDQSNKEETRTEAPVSQQGTNYYIPLDDAAKVNLAQFGIIIQQ